MLFELHDTRMGPCSRRAYCPLLHLRWQLPAPVCHAVKCVSLVSALDWKVETYFEAALDEEVPKTIDHQRVSLSNDSLNDIVFLLHRTDLQLLLKKDGCLLIVVADDLVYNITPVAVHRTIQQATVIKRFKRSDVRLFRGCWGLA